MYSRFSGLYSKLSDLGLTGLASKYYTGSSEFDSSWEEDIYGRIESESSLDISNLSHNINLGCKDKNPLPFDISFTIGTKKFIIEILGPTHFRKIYEDPIKDKFLLTRKHDMMKNIWARRNGWNLLYITLDPKYTNINYIPFPYYVRTSFTELLSDLKSIICS